MTTMIEKFFENNDMVSEPPIPCHFHVGATVIFTNEYGIEFGPHRVIGFTNQQNMLYGRFIHIDTDSPWFPVKPESLKEV